VGYKIGLELLVKCGFQKIVEVPIFFAQRQFGSSKLSLKTQVRYLQHLGRLLAYKSAKVPSVTIAWVKTIVSGNLLVVAYALLGAGLWFRNGTYSPTALALVLASFVCTLVACFRFDGNEPGRWPLAGCLGLFLALNSRAVAAYQLTSLWFTPAYQAFCGILLTVPVLVLLARRRLPLVVRGLLVSAAAVGAIFFRIMVPIVSPAPIIDVFAFSQESAQLLLKGKNPYVEKLRDPYQGQASFVVSEHFAFPPANLYPLTLSYLAFGDVRYLSVAGDLLVALVLYRITRARWTSETAELISLAFLFHPRGLYIINFAWTENILLACFALFLLLSLRGKQAAAAATYGYFLSLKQYLLFFFLHWFIVERKIWRVLLGIGVAVATAAPFIIWDFDSFWEGAILFNVTKTGFREDSLSITSALYPVMGPINKSLSVIVGGIVSLCAFGVMRNQGLAGYCRAATLSTFAMFVFGSQAFCNYYYLVGGLLLFTLIQSPPEPSPHEAAASVRKVHQLPPP
jgi:hypothetical protein